MALLTRVRGGKGDVGVSGAVKLCAQSVVENVSKLGCRMAGVSGPRW
jgi:hypothetical protein